MGNFFKSQKSTTEQTNHDMVMHLKSKNMEDVENVIDYLKVWYPTSSSYTIQTFEDCFGSYFDDYSEQAFLALENRHREDGRVDLYETLAAIAMLNCDEWETRLAFIFKMFDFNNNNELEPHEFIMTCQYSIRGMCKIVGLSCPSYEELEQFAKNIFPDLDTDHSKSISQTEFIKFVKFNWELQEFFLHFLDIQTWENAQRRSLESWFLYENLFKKIANAGSNQVQVSQLSSSFKQILQQFDNQTITFVMEILVETSQQLHADLPENTITSDAYALVMRANAAFDASDIKHTGKLPISELKYLIYANEGEKPDVFRCRLESQALQRSVNNFVTRREWLLFVCLNLNASATLFFRITLKKLFEKQQREKKSTLDSDQAAAVLKDTLKEFADRYREKGGQDDHACLTMIEGTVTSTLQALEKIRESRISWNDFRHTVEAGLVSQSQLANFIDLYK